ncbi:MAG: glycine zipper 2TM domain-containing protein, partial [Motiliproteus sp.]
MNKFMAIMVSLMMLSGCASTLDDKTYSRDQARRVQTVKFGTIEAINDVVLEGRRTVISKVAGAVVGGIAGSSVGGGKGKDLATAVGAIAGTIAGEALEERATRANGQDITVRMDQGELISIVQE